MAEYLTRKIGADFSENVVAVVYRNLWAWNVEQASKAYFLMIYPHVRNRPSYTFTTGFGALTRARRSNSTSGSIRAFFRSDSATTARAAA
jgi:hypothetical protein